jgi:hypothetical protein
MMAQSMLVSTSVSGGRALPSLQAARPAAAYPRFALPSSVNRHSKSVSVKTLALFKNKSKAAPAKKVRAVELFSSTHAHTACCSIFLPWAHACMRAPILVVVYFLLS